MQVQASRSVVVISGLLTLLVLGGGTLAVAFHNGWLQATSGTPRHETVAASPLDDAYAQIRALQSPHPQFASAGDHDERFTEPNGDDDHHERGSGGRESHDE